MNRLTLPLTLAIVLGTLLPAASVAAWTENCSTDGINGNKVCIYAHGNYVLPRAGMNGDIDQYVGKFPGNTSYYLNDETSSLSNLYLSRDVRWYWDAFHTGFNWCVDSWYSVADLGLMDRDQFSSHDVLSGDGAC